MRIGKWWVQPGILMVGDPTASMERAGEAFADDYVPMLFMTGDGHRHPPFEWTARPPWADFFAELVRDNSICCHVEKYADAVVLEDVPDNLRGVFQNHKVFGWEPEFYKTIQASQQLGLDFWPKLDEKPAHPKSEVVALTKAMIQVGMMGYARDESDRAMRIYELVQSLGDPVPTGKLTGLGDLIRDFQRATMRLRTEINKEIGDNIQKTVNTYPGDMHLITCGDAHIITNPLYKFIHPPVGTFGVADQSKHVG